MNFLAHLFLAERTPEGLLGSLMGDFVKGPLAGRFPPALAQSLAQHRRIDAFTDAHPVVRVSRTRVAPARRRFAGIMVDVFYDHFLALHWDDYADRPLPAFTGEVYALLHESAAILPERLRHIVPRMAQLDWLGSYRRIDAVHEALDRMGERLKRGNALRGAGAELIANYDGLEEDFRTFFPQVVDFVRNDRGDPP